MDLGGPARSLVDLRAVSWIGPIALCLRQPAHELVFEFLAEDVLRQLNDTSRELKNLYGLDAGQVIEKPAAARVHEHGVALHFEELEHRRGFRVVQCPYSVAGDKAANVCRRSVVDDVDVGIARAPRVL